MLSHVKKALSLKSSFHSLQFSSGNFQWKLQGANGKPISSNSYLLLYFLHINIGEQVVNI